MKINRRKLLSVLGASPAILAGTRALADETKKTTSATNHEPVIEALNPKGYPPAIRLIPMAPRLTSLDGKTVYLVSDGFAGADRFLNQIKIWFAKNMPSVRTEYRLKAGGLADDDPKLWAEIKAQGNAMIMAIGHCSTCTPATVGHCMTIEKMGIPTAPMVTIAFRELAQKNAADRGMPYERICYTPHPLTTKSDEQMWEVLQGKDPVTGKLLMVEVIGALTNPLTEEESKTGTVSPPRGDDFYKDTADNLQEHYVNNGMTDFMPIVLPTRKRVDAMLKGTSHKPDEIVGKLTPAPGAFPEWSFTVEQVATNAVMAGAKPEYFPVILAAASTGVTALFSSTSSFARMLVVNGPIRNTINMNSGIGAMGPFNDANATIGRAWTILSKNLCGGGMPGQTYMGTQGTGFNYNNLCFGETEEKMPQGWTPLHVQKGFKAEESTVSIFSGWSLNNVCWFSPLPIHEVIQGWLTHFFSTGNGAATLLLDPTVAHDVSNHGFGSKEDYSDWLMKNTKTPAWLYWQTRQKELKDAQSGVEPYASYLKLGNDADLPVTRFERRQRSGTAAGAPMSGIEILVLGGETNTYWMGGDFSYITSTSIDKWI